MAIASMVNSEVCRVSLSGKHVDDDQLTQMMVGNFADDVPRVLVLEDIDCLFDEDREAASNKGCVTFSGLLNALDGVGAAENAIVFLTTNHREKLDPALVRPGRVDKIVTFELPDDDCIVRHYRKFFPDESATGVAAHAFVRRCRELSIAQGVKCSMAFVQNVILTELEGK